MTTLPPSGMIYGVQADTLAAYVEAERAKVWEEAIKVGECEAYALAPTQTGDEQLAVRMILEALRAHAAKETPDAAL